MQTFESQCIPVWGWGVLILKNLAKLLNKVRGVWNHLFILICRHFLHAFTSSSFILTERMLNAEKDDFDQKRDCKTPICLPKYTTFVNIHRPNLFLILASFKCQFQTILRFLTCDFHSSSRLRMLKLGVVKRGPSAELRGMLVRSLAASKFDKFTNLIGLFWCVHVPLNRPRYVCARTYRGC